MSRHLWVLLAAALPALGCAGLVESTRSDLRDTLSKPRAVAGIVRDVKDDVKEYVNEVGFTPENEYFIGRSVAAKILADFEHDYQDKADWDRKQLAGLSAYVSQVGFLVAARTAEPETLGAWPMPGYHFIVLNEKEIGAYSTPGGFVFVTTGALAAMEDEEELACVPGHEIAHVSLRHGAHIAEATHVTNVTGELLANLAESTTGQPPPEVMTFFGNVVDSIVELIMDKGFGPVNEHEADEMGARLAMGAGYDPSAMARFIGKLPQPKEEKGFLSSHPKAADRIAKLRRFAQPAGAEGPSAARKARFQEATRKIR